MGGVGGLGCGMSGQHPKKQVKKGAKTVVNEITVVGSRPKPPHWKAGNVLLPAEKLRLSSFVTLRFTQLERSWNYSQGCKDLTFRTQNQILILWVLTSKSQTIWTQGNTWGIPDFKLPVNFTVGMIHRGKNASAPGEKFVLSEDLASWKKCSTSNIKLCYGCLKNSFK